MTRDTDNLREENDRLRRLVAAMAERMYAMSVALSRCAERRDLRPAREPEPWDESDYADLRW